MTEKSQKNILSQLSDALSNDYRQVQEKLDENYREILESHLDVPEEIEFTSVKRSRYMGIFLALMMLVVSVFYFSTNENLAGFIFLSLGLVSTWTCYKNWNAYNKVFMRLTRNEIVLEDLLDRPIRLIELDEYRINDRRTPTLSFVLKESAEGVPGIKNKFKAGNKIQIKQARNKPPIITLKMQYGIALNGKALTPQEISDILYTQYKAAVAYHQLYVNGK